MVQYEQGIMSNHDTHQPALCDEVEVVAVKEPDEADDAVALGSHC